MNQNEAKCSISGMQEAAISLALVGKSDVDIAKECKVARSTLWRWKTQDAAYIAEYNRRRKELWASSEQKLFKLVPIAIDVLEERLAGPEAMTAAVHILKAAGVYGKPHNPSRLPDSVEEVERDQRNRQEMAMLSDALSIF